MIEKIGLVVVGASSGGLEAMITLLQSLPQQYATPMVCLLHQRANRESGVPKMLSKFTHLTVREPDDKEPIRHGHLYVAPPNYHLLIEKDKTFALSLDAPVNFCRPSIDMLFESAADVYASKLAACVLTGANNDGAKGALYVKNKGARLFVQSPQQATVNIMPKAVLEMASPDAVVDLDDLGKLLGDLCCEGMT